MEERIGLVYKAEKNYIYIVSMRESACGTSCKTCSAKSCESQPIKIKLINTIDAKPGDFIKIEIPSKYVILYILNVYGIPCLALIFGVLISSFLLTIYNIDNKDIYSLLIGLVIMGLSYFIVKFLDKKFGYIGIKNIIIKKFKKKS